MGLPKPRNRVKAASTRPRLSACWLRTGVQASHCAGRSVTSPWFIRIVIGHNRATSRSPIAFHIRAGSVRPHDRECSPHLHPTAHQANQTHHHDSPRILPLRKRPVRPGQRHQGRHRLLLLQLPEDGHGWLLQPEGLPRRCQGHQGHPQGLPGQLDPQRKAHGPLVLRRLRHSSLERPLGHPGRPLPQGRHPRGPPQRRPQDGALR